MWIGELSGGKSATSPTFCKSTSVRTRIDLQYSQVVWTLLDHKKTTFAPQLGHCATGCVIPQLPSSQAVLSLPADDVLYRRSAHCMCAPCFGQSQNSHRQSRAGAWQNPIPV